MIFSSITFFGPDDAVIWSSLDRGKWDSVATALKRLRVTPLYEVQEEAAAHPLTGESMLVFHVPGWWDARRGPGCRW